MHSLFEIQFYLLTNAKNNKHCLYYNIYISKSITVGMFLKILFYWSIVDLQCVNFCCTAKWFSNTYIHILLHIFFHCLSQDIFPVLYSRTLLFILSIYISLSLLTPKSQSSLPPTASPLTTTSLFSMSVILFLFHR